MCEFFGSVHIKFNVCSLILLTLCLLQGFCSVWGVVEVLVTHFAASNATPSLRTAGSLALK